MEKCATQIPFTLSHCGVPTLQKCGSMCELCTVMCAREKCASALRRTHGCCHWLSAKLRFSNFCGNRIKTRLRSDLPVDGNNVELVVLSRPAPVSWMLKREFDVRRSVLWSCHVEGRPDVRAATYIVGCFAQPCHTFVTPNVSEAAASSVL